MVELVVDELQEDSEGKSNANCENNLWNIFVYSQEKNDDESVLQDENGVEDELSPKSVTALIPAVVKRDKIVDVDVAEPVDKTIVENL